MKKLTLDMCHVHVKIRRKGEEDEAFAIPTDDEIQNHPENLTLAVEVSFGGFHATSVRLPLSQVRKEQQEQSLTESALVWLKKDMREARDLLSQYDLSNELREHILCAIQPTFVVE